MLTLPFPACDCNPWGSVTSDCHKETGDCTCKPGIVGQQCDICGSDFAIITDSGCFECTGCSLILKDYMGELREEIGKTIRLKESGGRINEDIERLIDMKNEAILLKVMQFSNTHFFILVSLIYMSFVFRLQYNFIRFILFHLSLNISSQKEALDAAGQIDRYEGMWGVTVPIRSGSVKYEYNKIADFFDTSVVDKVNLSNNSRSAFISNQWDPFISQTAAYTLSTGLL